MTQAKLFFIFEELSDFITVEDPSVWNYIFAMFYVVSSTVKNIQGCYCVLFYVISVYGFTIISYDFRNSCNSENDTKQILKQYRSICRLLKYHEKYCGWGLMWFIFSGIFCCTFFLVLDSYASYFGALGVFIFKLWSIFFYVFVIGLGIIFTTMVSCIYNKNIGLCIVNFNVIFRWGILQRYLREKI